MAQQRKQVTIIGNGDGNQAILAQGGASTAATLIPSQPRTSIGQGNTKPVSLPEGLSLLQTNCFDLRSMGCEVSILARGNRVYVILATPPDTGAVSMKNGHIAILGVPVSDIVESEK